METRTIRTRFMTGNKTDEVFDLLADYYGMKETCSDEIDYCEAIFSDGFIYAVTQGGMIPVLGSHKEVRDILNQDEYHHLIFNDVCYVVYFKEM